MVVGVGFVGYWRYQLGRGGKGGRKWRERGIVAGMGEERGTKYVSVE